jgi:hypothetical protein
MRKRTLVATLGAAGAVTLAGIGVAIAEPTTTPSPSPSTAAPDEDTEEKLQGLGEDGTLTEEQVDRVADELDDSPGGGHWWGWGHHGHHGWDGSDADFDRGWEAAAQALGMTTQELEDALSEDGTSLADVAEQRGVPSQTVVDALVAAAEERIAARLAEGSLSQEQADELRAEIPDWVAAAVENDWWSHWGDHDD